MSEAQWVRGHLLTPSAQKEALGKFVHRMTIENAKRFPKMAAQMRARGYHYKLISDQEWLRATEFARTKDFRLDRRVKRCHIHFGELPHGPDSHN